MVINKFKKDIPLKKHEKNHMIFCLKTIVQLKVFIS